MKRRGFTLVELLAVVIVLTIILVIAIPKISDVISNARQGAFKSTNSMIVSELQRVNALEITPQIYTLTNGVISPELSISGELPDSGTIEINVEGQIQVVTSNEDYCAIKRFDEDTVAVFDAGDRLCNVVVEITLTVDPNGGTYNSTTSNTTYTVETDGTQNIGTPTRDGYTFGGWDLTCTECLVGNTYTASQIDDTLTATWGLNPVLTINLDGGSTGTSYNSRYPTNANVSLDSPTKTGFVFTGWSVSGTGSTIENDDTLVMGTADTTLTANWVADSLTCSITSSGTTSTVNSSWYIGNVTLNLVITEGNSSVSQKGLASSQNSTNNLTTMTVTTDTSGTTYYGHVLTGTGKDVSCTKTIKKDATVPTCTITSPTLWATTMTLNASDNIALAASPYSWTSSSSGFSTTNTKTGTTGTSVYNAWVKDAVGNVGACRLTCGSFSYVGPGYTDGTCNGGAGMNYYSGCVQWTSSSQCCRRTGHYRCGVKSECYTDNRYSRTCTSATVAP